MGEGKSLCLRSSVLCVGWMEQGPGAAERRSKGQVEDLRMYSSCQDAVGSGGEAIELREEILTRTLNLSGSRVGKEMVWRLSRRTGDRTANEMVQQFKVTGHPIFTSTSALSRGILKQKRGRTRFCEYGTLVSIKSVSVRPSRIGVINSVRQMKKKSGILTMVEPEEVEMLVSPPSLPLGNKMQGGASFRILEKRVQMTQLCEKSYSSLL